MSWAFNVYVKGTSRSTYLLLKINLAISDDRKLVMAFISIALASCSVNFYSAIHFSSQDFISFCSSGAFNGLCCLTVFIAVSISELDRWWSSFIKRGHVENEA